MMEVSRNDVNSLVNKAVRDIETRLPDLIAASVVQSVAIADATSGITGEMPHELDVPVSILDGMDLDALRRLLFGAFRKARARLQPQFGYDIMQEPELASATCAAAGAPQREAFIYMSPFMDMLDRRVFIQCVHTPMPAITRGDDAENSTLMSHLMSAPRHTPTSSPLWTDEPRSVVAFRAGADLSRAQLITAVLLATGLQRDSEGEFGTPPIRVDTQRLIDSTPAEAAAIYEQALMRNADLRARYN